MVSRTVVRKSPVQFSKKVLIRLAKDLNNTLFSLLLLSQTVHMMLYYFEFYHGHCENQGDTTFIILQHIWMHQE
jgi:hypothetical protein